MDLTSLDILYIVLSIFISILWTLLTIIFFKIIKILNTITEMIFIYNKIKDIISIYSHFPKAILEIAKKSFFNLFK